jgi:glutamate dehydrogenase/leucine dehydrogenase
MRIHWLTTVDAFIAFDLDVPTSAGGTRLAPDVTEVEAKLLARAMTYKFAALHVMTGGAKGAVRAKPDERAEAMAQYCAEIAPLIADGTFLTGPDLGTSESDFAPLRGDDPVPSVMTETVRGVPVEDLLTGFGVAVAAEAALGSLDGCSVAIEGFGKVGGGVAREVLRRGGDVVAVSTIAGCVHDARGLDVDTLWAARAKHGDDFVHEVGGRTLAAEALFDLAVDVVVPGARTGVIDAKRAKALRARVVAPAANVPYTAKGLAMLRDRGIPALPDFVCNAGAVIGYLAPRGTTVDEAFELVEDRVARLITEAGEHPAGHYVGAVKHAERFLTTWRPKHGMPGGPPLAS